MKKRYNTRRTTMDKKEKNDKAKEALTNLWQKTSDISKKAAEGAKALAEQTKQNIHNAQAKKYLPVISKEFKNKSFKLPSIIKIVDDTSNRSFISDDDAIGWIEKYDDVDVLHLYYGFTKKCGLNFIPVPQQDNVYYSDNFDSKKFINTNNIFGKAMEEKLSELEHIAHYLGAKSCSIEIVESNYENNFKKMSVSSPASTETSAQSQNCRSQSGKTVSHFQGNNTPQMPILKWFAHDDNIKRLIEMRCSDSNAIKSKILELKGSASATMSKKNACAIDKIMNIKGGLSMEKQTVRECNNVLIYEIEF